jgi:hypothetical protein
LTRKPVCLGLLFLLAGSMVAGVSIFSGSDSSKPTQHPKRSLDSAAPRAEHSTLGPGTPARFSYLAKQTTNSCGLRAEHALAYASNGRLQGSCCFPMDAESYRDQVRGLRKYSRIAEIPRDPYDIRVSLAKRLLHYQKNIDLSARQRRTYKRAMRMTRQKGPCCCRCWRWEAFDGMSRYLIARRGWRAEELARVIDLVEGCGGPKSPRPPA